MSDAAVLLALLTALFSAATIRAIQCFSAPPAPPPPPEPPSSNRLPPADAHARPNDSHIRHVVFTLASLCVAGAVCGGYRWYETLGRIRETHTVGEYRFRITSERDPEWADLGESGENISVAVYHRGRFAKRIHIGSISDESPPPRFNVRSLPNESLLIVTRADREHHVVCVYDTATGDACYDGVAQKYEDYRQRCEHFERRIRACLRDDRYFMCLVYHS